MKNMREILLSNCEKEFILKAVSQRKRLDGRGAYDYRRIKIWFGVDRGCCHVELGNTRVMAQVSSEVTSPKQTRPSEGILFINVELSPMAAPQFETRPADLSVELNRLLERCLKDSRCVDMESLCIMAGSKVWTVRVDIHVLNHDGNLIDGASIAAIAALSHFRRPDVTVSSEEVTIHTAEEKDPVPLSVHHMPICVTFAFFDQGKYLLVDPLEREERVMEGKMVIGMNKHREICALQMTGSMLLLKDQVLRCSNIAVVKVTEITDLIWRALSNDSKARTAGKKFGSATSFEIGKFTSSQSSNRNVTDAEILRQKAQEIVQDAREEDEMEQHQSKLQPKVTKLGPGTAIFGEGGPSTWTVKEDEEMETEGMQEQLQVHKQQQPETEPEIVVLSGDSEEDDVVLLHSVSSDQIDLTD